MKQKLKELEEEAAKLRSTQVSLATLDQVDRDHPVYSGCQCSSCSSF
jgi:hypothetical protein